MLGIARLLANEPLIPEYGSQVADIVNAGEHLLSLVNDLLNLAKLEAGKLELNLAPVDLRQLIEETATMLYPQAKTKSLEIRINYTKDIPHLLIADGKAMRQILLNLLGNALKFTQEGYIEIKIELLQQYSTEVSLKISVSDTGIGIPTEQLATVFERFNQIDNSRTCKYGGSGLGLTINKAFIELMGGNIHVFSELNKGSTFSFDLTFPLQTTKTITPIREQWQNPLKPQLAIAPLQSEHTFKVLLVEDHPIIQKVHSMMLKKIGCIVDIANDGTQALTIFKNGYDAILLDIALGEMSGLDVAIEIRRREVHGHRVPIIAMTGYGDEDSKACCLDVGMNAIAVKPTTSETLKQLLEYWVVKTT